MSTEQQLIESLLDNWEAAKRGDDITTATITKPPPSPLPSQPLSYISSATLAEVYRGFVNTFKRVDEKTKQEMFYGVPLIVHSCTTKCRFYSNPKCPSLYICRISGNLHECSDVFCDHLWRHSSHYVCTLTGNTYPIGIVSEERDVYDPISGMRMDPVHKTKSTTMTTDDDINIKKEEGESKLLTKSRNLLMKAERDEKLDRMKMPPPPPRVPYLQRKRAFVNDPTPVLRYTDSTNSNSITNKPKQQINTSKRQRLDNNTTTITTKRVNSIHALDPCQQQSIALNLFKQLLGNKPCCDKYTIHTSYYVSHCCLLWRYITQSKKYHEPKGGGSSYDFHSHCKVVMRNMILGISHPESKQSIIPMMKCLYIKVDKVALMSQSGGRSTRGRSKKTLTETNKKLQEYITLLDPLSLAELEKSSLKFKSL